MIVIRFAVLAFLALASLLGGSFSSSPTSLSFSATSGSSVPSSQTLTLSGTAGNSIAVTSAGWLTVAPSGTIPGTLAVTVNQSGLPSGTYSARITIAESGSTSVSVPVTLVVSAAAVTPAFQSISLTEEFCGGVITSGSIGSLGWVGGAVGAGAAVVNNSTGEVGHPCILRMTTGTANSGIAAINLGGNGTYTGWAGAGLQTTAWQYDVVFKFPTNPPSATNTFSTGLTADLEVIGLRYDPAISGDTQFVYTGDEIANPTAHATAGVTPAAGTWYHFRMYRQTTDAANIINFCMGACTSSTQLTVTTTILNNFIAFMTISNGPAGTTSRSVDIDAWSLANTGLTRY